MGSGSEPRPVSTGAPWDVVRRLSAGQRLLVLDVTTEPGGGIDALLDDTSHAVHVSTEHASSIDERFAIGIASFGRDIQSVRSAIDALRSVLIPDGVAILIWDPSALTAEATAEVVQNVQESFAVSYVLADATLWSSQVAPPLLELSASDGPLFMAIASDATWRLLSVASTVTPAEELKPIFRVVAEQAIHLDDQRSLLKSFEKRIGVQEQQLDVREQQLGELQSRVAGLQDNLASALDCRQAAESANAALAAELELWEARYALVVGSRGWRLLEHVRKLVRLVRRPTRG